MSADHAPETTGEAAFYEIRVRGHLDTLWEAWFEDLTVAHRADGTTTLRGWVADQAALYGHLARLRDTGMVLLSLQRLQK